MARSQDYYPDCPEAFIVGLARTGDRDAFSELVRRYQCMVRNLMRRCCRDHALADDLAQQAFLKAWLNLRALKKQAAFGAWLRRIAISIWLQHVRKRDPLADAEPSADRSSRTSPDTAMDLDLALAGLPPAARLCIVLSYHQGMTHQEIADATDIPLGTVKSHIARGTARLQQMLAAYREKSGDKTS